MQYKTGSVTVTYNSPVIAGSGVAWVSNVSAGDLFKKKDTNIIYEVASVSGESTILLTANYANSGESGMEYIITTDFTPNYHIPEINAGDVNWPDVLTRGLRIIDAALVKINEIKVIDYTVDCTTGDGKAYFIVPEEYDGYTISYIAASCITPGTTNTMDIQVHNASTGDDLLTTKVKIDSAAYNSYSNTPVIDPTYKTVSTGNIIRIDIDALHDTPAKGLIVILSFNKE